MCNADPKLKLPLKTQGAAREASRGRGVLERGGVYLALDWVCQTLAWVCRTLTLVCRARAWVCLNLTWTCLTLPLKTKGAAREASRGRGDGRGDLERARAGYPETRNPEFETRNPKSEARNPKPETQNLKLGNRASHVEKPQLHFAHLLEVTLNHTLNPENLKPQTLKD